METLNGEGSDRFPFYDLDPAEDTIKSWHKEGLPRWRSVAKYFELETHHSVGVTLRSYPFYQKASGLLDDPSAFNRHYHPDQKGRFLRNFVKRAKRIQKKGRVLYVDAWGGGLLQMLGVGDWESLVAACLALIDRPKQVEELIEKTTDFYCACLERSLSAVSVDYATLYEPIASNKGPVVSPAMFKRFVIPGYRKVIDLLEKYHVPLRIFCTTGGDLTLLLDMMIDAGVNGLWISNTRSAELGYKKLRQRYGREMALIGGIDATALTQDASKLKKTVERIVPPLLDSGRYLPCLDDRPRSNMPFDNYRLYRRILEDISRKG